MTDRDHIDADLTIVGAGIAGLSAALFAAVRGASVAIVGGTGASDFSSGLFDLLGALPGSETSAVGDPWSAIRILEAKYPAHPLAKAGSRAIAGSLEETLGFLAGQRLKYTGWQGENTWVPTQLGTAKATYRLPETMLQGAVAYARKSPCLFLDIDGVKDFDAKGMVASLREQWPGIRSGEISFPGRTPGTDAQPLLLARSLENAGKRRDLAEAISACLDKEEAVGLPPLLGIRRPGQVQRDLQERVGVPVFEVPALPNPVPGARLREVFRDYLHGEDKASAFLQHRVLGCSARGERDFLLHIGGDTPQKSIRCGSLILASGRFLGQGLWGERGAIRERLMDLPVKQPQSRSQWHCADLFDPLGHEVNLAGIETDSSFRPLDSRGRIIQEGLYAIGSILAHSDWTRFKCGAGMCVATAWRAVESIQDRG